MDNKWVVYCNKVICSAQWGRCRQAVYFSAWKTEHFRSENAGSYLK